MRTDDLVGARMNFINPRGLPTILVEGSLLRYWHGNTQDPLRDQSDYERACDTDDVLREIVIGPGRGIVLFGLPTYVTFVQRSEVDVVVVRVTSVDSHDDLLREVHEVANSKQFAPSGIPFTTAGRDCYLLPATASGVEATREALRFEVKPGDYNIATWRRDSARQTVVLHRMTLALGAAP